MCCIGSRDDNGLPPYKCCCCCNIFCGVVIIFLLEVFWLVSASMILDIVGMSISGVLCLLFMISFCAQGSLWSRQALFWGYLGRAIALIITMTVYALTNKIDDILNMFCKAVNEYYEWDSCWVDLQGTFFFVLISYTVVVFLFRLWLARILYYYLKELIVILNGGEEEDAFQQTNEETAKEKLVQDENTPNQLN